LINKPQSPCSTSIRAAKSQENSFTTSTTLLTPLTTVLLFKPVCRRHGRYKKLHRFQSAQLMGYVYTLKPKVSSVSLTASGLAAAGAIAFNPIFWKYVKSRLHVFK
jgi:hypothetical protein